MQKTILLALLFLYQSPFVQSQTQVKRPLRPGDVYRLPVVGDPSASPDGKWIAFTLTTVDSAKDKNISHIWMASWDGTQQIQMTNGMESETRPRWSPDGKFLCFLSARQDSNGSQVWLLDRRGGEALRLTDLKTAVSDYAWSPDGKKLLLTVPDKDPDDSIKSKTTKPYVIDRFQFKEDIGGYRYKNLYTHLYLFDVAAKKTDTLTKGNFNESEAEWSPDGSRIAFVSNHTQDPDKNENTDIFVIDAKPGQQAEQLTSWKGIDKNPRWSPDGKFIAYTRSTQDADYLMYDQSILCVISSQGGEPRLLSREMDRPVMNPRWNKDGSSIAVLVEDDMQQYVGSISLKDGKVTRVADGPRAFTALESSPDGSWLVKMSEPQIPGEIYCIESGKLRRISTKMDEFLKPLSLATVESFRSKSSDGTQVSGLLFRPPGTENSKKLPLILFIHGGPVGQDDYGFDMRNQMLSAAGYVVAAVNYRGSSGRGLAYCKAIFADWGNKEVIDLHGAVDHLVQAGIADPERLGVGGWSYGGILTDYLIASDNRFKAASSGAGTGFTLSLYGVDQYIAQYSNEIGPPWKNMDTYIKISYPLLKADRIKTPTLFMSGEKDFNVPTAGSEQMYQALRSLGIPTQLIIYPGQFHGFTTPSYLKDRYERYVAWYNKYLSAK